MKIVESGDGFYLVVVHRSHANGRLVGGKRWRMRECNGSVIRGQIEGKESQGN